MLDNQQLQTPVVPADEIDPMAVERLTRWCRAGRVTPARLGRAVALPAAKHRVLLLALELQDQKPASGFRRGPVLPDEDGLVPR